MKLRNLEKMLEDNKIVLIQMYDLTDELTHPIDFEYENGKFKTVINDTEYDLINLLGNSDIESIFPCIFDKKLCLNIIIKTELENKEEILSALGIMNY